jgi:pectinesterase
MIGTFNSATVIVNASDFAAMNITFANSFGDGSQAVAIQVNADRAAFKNCRFMGNQDTLLTNGTAGQRNYFKNCYIDGNVDFIFGSAVAIFDSCVIYAKARSNTGSSFITAANTPAGQAYGYILRNCKIPANTGGTLYYLGRPWQNSTGASPVANNKVVYLNAALGTTIQPAGWTIWDAGTNTSLIYYAEYKSRNFSGGLTDIGQRVPWSLQLGDADTANFSLSTVFGTWNPLAVSADFAAYQPPSIVISNLAATKTASATNFTWNISWPMSQIKYELFRSAGSGVAYSKIGETDAVTDTSVNFSLTDALPPPGALYTYYIQASAPGQTTLISDTLTVSSKPAITISGTPGSFIQGLGTPSAAQRYAVSGVNLVAGITIAAPAGYELSSNGGATWSNSSTPIALPQLNGIITSDTVSIRLNATTAGTYAGNILHSSDGADTVGLPVTGTVQTAPLIVSNVLIHWPMTGSAADNAAERSSDIAPDTATFNRLFPSNGATVPTVPAFSTNFGQAFGPSSNGDGTWSTAVGGPGGNLNRGVYEQLLLTTTGADSIRVDSLILDASFFNTSSNTKMGIVYSLSGFTTDSTDVAGAAFATPIALPNETSTTSSGYRLAFAGATGLIIPGGRTITIRLYFSCGSSSSGRYGKVKDIFIKGAAKAPPMNPSLALGGTLHSFFQDLGIPSDARAYTLTGTNLTGSVRVLAPPNYEISADSGLTWHNSSAPVTLSPAGNSLNTSIAVRLNAAATGTYSGSVAQFSAGADTLYQSVTGLTGSNATLPLAFPGAEGFGRFAQGGRGGTVYQVTNLNDAGPGSLRDAVSQPNRTVVFRVSGTILLNSTLKITNDNITIAVQTAPGGGICVSGYTTTIAANNIIIRYMRFRLGDTQADIDDACNSFKGSFHDIIIDHCSMSWSIDETGSFYDIQQFTLQWSILSESLFHSVDPKGNHGYAGIWGGQGATFHHNLLADHSSRNPRFSGSRYLGNTVTGTVDMRNNVIYNWGDINSSYGGEGGTQNMINNYYKAGPATPGSLTTSSISNKRNRILNYTSFYYADDAFVFPDTLFGGKFYIDGNFVEGYPDVTADNWTKGVQPDDYVKADSLIAAARQSVAFPFAPVNTQSAPDAYIYVLNNSGALFPQRDTVDRRILREARTGTADFEGGAYAAVSGTGITHPSGIIDSQNDVGGWPTLVSAAPLADSDQDGMPDIWEIRRGLNPLDPNDRNGISANGYTNLENFLNGDSITAPGILNSCVAAPLIALTNSGSWVPARDTASSRQIPTDTANLIASIRDNNGAGTLSVSYYTSSDLRLLPNTRPYLSRNFSIVPATVPAGGLTIRVYFSAAEFNALQAADTSIKSLADLSVLQVNGAGCMPALTGTYTVITATGSGRFGTYNDGYYLQFTTGSFGNFFIAGSSSAALSPFAFVSFNALAGTHSVTNYWTTNNLLGVSDFVVERGTDTTNFQSVGTVTTADSSGHFSYTFADTHPSGHTAWYRVKAERTIGAPVYSPTVEVGSNLSLLVLPNPAFNVVIVLYPALLLDKKAMHTTLELYSSGGQLMRTISVPNFSLETTIDISRLAKGVYILVLNSNGVIGTTSFIKL